MNQQRLLNEVSKEYRKVARIKECFHHNKDECKGKIKQAHSIQKSGKLSILESEINGNLQVYSFTSASQTKQNIVEELIPIGKKVASVFFGFCDYHDSKLFSEIENNEFNQTDEHLFLHSYRSFAHSYHQKNEEIKAWKSKGSDYYSIIENAYGKEAVELRNQQFLFLEDQLEKRKAILDESISNKKYDNLDYLFCEFDGVVPIATAGLITPYSTYSNKVMNNNDNVNFKLSQPIFTLLPGKERSLLIIAAFNYDELSIEFIDELDEFPNYKFERALSSIIIDSCQNTIISLKFWDNLEAKARRLILNEYSVVSVQNWEKPKIFKSKFNFFKRKYFLKT